MTAESMPKPNIYIIFWFATCAHTHAYTQPHAYNDAPIDVMAVRPNFPLLDTVSAIDAIIVLGNFLHLPEYLAWSNMSNETLKVSFSCRDFKNDTTLVHCESYSSRDKLTETGNFSHTSSQTQLQAHSQSPLYLSIHSKTY